MKREIRTIEDIVSEKIRRAEEVHENHPAARQNEHKEKANDVRLCCSHSLYIASLYSIFRRNAIAFKRTIGIG